MRQVILPALLTTLLILLGGCRDAPSGNGGNQTSDLALRVYEVPPALTEEISLALNDVLLGGEHLPSLGRVSRQIDGRVVVAAPANFHEDIAQVLESLVAPAGDQGSAQPGAVRLSVWVVEEAETGRAIEPRLAAIAPALEQLRTASGVEHFVLVDHLTAAVALPDGEGQIQGAVTDATFMLRPQGRSILATVEISNRVEQSGGKRTVYGSRTEHLPLPLDGFVVLQQHLIGGAEGVSRMRSVILQASNLDNG